MSDKIGIISDLHAAFAPVKEAFSIFEQKQVDAVYCLGDITGYGDELDKTVELLIAHQCQSILGNHEAWYLEKHSYEQTDCRIRSYFSSLPRALELDIAGISLHLVHAEPPRSYDGGIRLLDEQGLIMEEQKVLWQKRLESLNCDVLLVGHTHQVYAELLGSVLVINPGSTRFNHSCAILNLPELELEWYSLSNQQLIRVWNWGSNQLD